MPRSRHRKSPQWSIGIPEARATWTRHTATRATPHGRRLAVASGIATCLLVGVGLVWQASYEAFTAAAGSGSNTWTTGTVTISSTPGIAMFTASGLKPGDTATACVKVTYTGSVAAVVRLYLSNGDLTGTGLATYLTLQISEGSGDNADCSDFSQAANDYNNTGMTDTTKTIAAFNAASHDYATGVSSWNATQNATKTYALSWGLQDTSSAAGLTASMVFTWEAGSS